jgi:hypothetical protein
MQMSLNNLKNISIHILKYKTLHICFAVSKPTFYISK